MARDSATFDYVVVGAGSAGSVVAARLSEDADATVLLLEEGPTDHEIEVERSFVPDIFAAWNDPRIARAYAVTGASTQAAPSMLRGVVRGGCSSVNGMIYIRGNRANFDAWAAAGCDGWAYADVLPLFKASEDHVAGPDDWHGVGGPLPVRPMIAPTPPAAAFVRAALELNPGWGGVDPDAPGGRAAQWDFNGARQEDGAGLYEVTVTRDGRRASAAGAFLDPLADVRTNLTEVAGALVRRVVTEADPAAPGGRRATGVEALVGGAPVRFRATREVVLCAGAFGSPAILLRSGIGPAVDLAALGIDVVANRPGVGGNLHDHLLALQYFTLRTKPPQPKFIAEAGLFTRVRAPAGAAPDLQYHFAAGMDYFTPPGAPAANCVFCPTAAQPASRGRLRLFSADPRIPPHVDMGYLREAADVDVLVAGMEMSRALVATRAFREMNGGPLDDVTPGLEDGDAAYVRRTARTVWHPVGTCRMGRAGDVDTVVDPDLRVVGVDGLRVADASIMPTITSGNTNAACIMIGEKAARTIRAQAGGGR